MSLKLSDIKKPTRVKVTSINGEDAVRILEMGITPGIELEVLRLAPLGFPIEIKVRGYMLSLRESEANSIEIE
ncbi:MAG: FeoA domain-containing protein [Balneolaceae bacterium]